MFHVSRFTFQGKGGQAMILTVVALGATLLGATTIAGLLTVYQIRQTTDFGNSAKAIFAADTGIEWGLYQFFKPTGVAVAPVFSNNASVRLVCMDRGSMSIPCTSSSTASFHSVGVSARAIRALELNL